MIEAGFFDLNTRNAELNWEPIATRAGFSAKQLASELARLSLPRLEEYFLLYIEGREEGDVSDGGQI